MYRKTQLVHATSLSEIPQATQPMAYATGQAYPSQIEQGMARLESASKWRGLQHKPAQL
jgi:hypothetical protein